MTRADFDVDAFLAQPLTARVATNGSTVRPTWYLWEDHAFWVLTGPWTKLLSRYLGLDETRWNARFRHYLYDDPADRGTAWLRLRPAFLTAVDLSYRAANP